MKPKLYNIPVCAIMIVAVLLLLVAPASLFGQITMVESNFTSIFAPGQIHRFYNSEGRVTSVNVGLQGGANVYDFSGLAGFSLSTSNNYLVSSIPTLAARYPGSAVTFGSSPDSVEKNPVFLFGTDTMFVLGEASLVPQLRFKHYRPYQLAGVFPFTYGDSITYSYELYDTTYNTNGTVALATQASGVDSSVIDGYGTLKIPGYTFQCLRGLLRHTSFGDKEFMYFTKEGVFVDVFVASSEPDTGVVNVMNVMVLVAENVTGVQQRNEGPSVFSVRQNYPNPFNPSTEIAFTIPTTSRVRLSVFNLLGQHVADVFSGELSAGDHVRQWHASVASGVYFYRLEAVPLANPAKMFVGTRKMVLVR